MREEHGQARSVRAHGQEQEAGTAKVKDLRVAFKEKGDNESIVPRGELVARVVEMISATDRRTV